ncbi:MAG: class I SAM-dependent methyltransferase [Acidimicrobiia bacterium]
MAPALQRLLSRLRRVPPATPPLLQQLKVDLIDWALSEGHRTFADLGGVWAVEAGYSFYAAEAGASRVVLVDTGITEAVRARAAGTSEVELVGANFGDPGVVGAIGSVDAVMLFDVLLHQVDPDWDEILRMYAPVTKCFLIANPQYTASPSTIRLLDLGRDAYLATVPPVSVHDEALQRLDEIHPKYARRYRDIHEIWQWGIVDQDLDAVMQSLGFSCVRRENAGPWFGLAEFDQCAFAYARP